MVSKYYYISRLCCKENNYCREPSALDPIKSRVPSIWFVWKSYYFLVTRENKLGARGHPQALLEHSPASPLWSFEASIISPSYIAILIFMSETRGVFDWLYSGIRICKQFVKKLFYCDLWAISTLHILEYSISSWFLDIAI